MIKLTNIIKEERTNPMELAAPFFKEFTSIHKKSPKWKPIGLKDKEYVFTAPIEDLGTLSLIFSDAQFMARVTDKYAYFGIIYTLNGLEQFDATVCYIKKTDKGFDHKLFDDSDPDFTTVKTNFIKLIKIMV